MMKKFLGLLLSFTLLLSIVVTPVSAESVSDFTVRVSDATATAGDDRVAVDIVLENNPGIAGFSFCVNYDTEKLVLVDSEINIENGYKVIAQPTGYGVNLAWTGPSGYSEDGKIATLYFNIPKNLTVSEANIDIVYREGYDSFYDSHEHDIAVNTVNGKISIAALQEADRPSVNVDGVSVNFGATDIVVPISVKNNPGFSGFSFCVNYDTSRLVLENTNITIDGGYKVIGHPEGYAVNIGWTSTETYTQDGTIAELHFSLKDNANSGKAYINVAFREGYDSFYGFVNGTEQDIAFDAFSGYVDINNHHFGDWVVTTPATCTATGLKIRTCSDCSATETVVIPKVAHEYVAVTTAPTCIAKGYTTHTCKNCSDYYVDDYVDIVEHTLGEWEVKLAPECEVKGEEIQKCTVCKATINTRIIDETGHDFDDWFVVSVAKFNEDGQERRDCKNCDHYETKRIPKLSEGHTCDYTGAEEIIENATCTTDGLKKVYCNVAECEKYIIVDIVSTGHIEGEWEVKVPATCTETGTEVKKCTVCNEELQTIPINATGHNYSSEWSIDVAPDCTNEGSKSHHCTACGDKKDVTIIEALGHTSGDWVVDVPSTCTQEGIKSCYCTVCNDLLKTEAIPCHFNTIWITEQEPTCTEIGYTNCWCLDCGEIVDVTVIDFLGHDYSVFVSVEEEHPHTITNKCSRCNSVKKESSYSDSCVFCNFSYEIIDDETCRITGYIGKSTVVKLPSVIEGRVVIATATGAFRNNTTITAVIIGDGVQSIGALSFMGCTSLTKVVIPASVTSIGTNAFYNCPNIVEVATPCNSCASTYFDESVLVLSHGEAADWVVDKNATCTETGLKHGECSLCGALVTEIIPVTSHDYIWQYDYESSIKTGTCSVCGNVLTEKIHGVLTFTLNANGTGYTVSDCVSNYQGRVIIPSEFNGLPVTAIGTDAFRDCKGITSVYVPDTVTSIGGSAFRNCTSLTDIRLSEKLTSIPGAMCFGCTSLESIVIPESVTSLGGYAFSGCTSLVMAVIPESVNVIGGSVFASCKSLVIFCKANTAIHTYADDNNIPYILIGGEIEIDTDRGFIFTDIEGMKLSDIFSDNGSISYTMDTEYVGTGSIISVYDGDELICLLPVIVNGDTNGDSVCDALDAAQVALVSSGQSSFDGFYELAADNNGDGVVDINDYQAVINKVVS